MAIRYKSNVINSTPVPSTGEAISLNSLRRNSRSQLNRSIKLEKKIYGAKEAPIIIETFTIWEFNDPTGTEVVDYTFNFTGKGFRVDDFGDGTNVSNINSGVTFTKNYN